MQNSHAAISTRKGFNYGVWFGFIVNENKVSKSCWIIIGSSWMLLIKMPYRRGHTILTRQIFWRSNVIQQWRSALEFCKVRIKLLGLTFKEKKNIFPNQQPLSSPTITLPHLYYKVNMMPIAIHSQQEPLIYTLTQQGLLAVVQVAVSFLLSLLIYTFQVWEAVNVSM